MCKCVCVWEKLESQLSVVNTWLPSTCTRTLLGSPDGIDCINSWQADDVYDCWPLLLLALATPLTDLANQSKSPNLLMYWMWNDANVTHLEHLKMTLKFLNFRRGWVSFMHLRCCEDQSSPHRFFPPGASSSLKLCCRMRHSIGG